MGRRRDWSRVMSVGSKLARESRYLESTWGDWGVRGMVAGACDLDWLQFSLLQLRMKYFLQMTQPEMGRTLH